MPRHKEDEQREKVARLAANALIDGRVTENCIHDSDVETSTSMSINPVLSVNSVPTDNCITEGAEIRGKISAVRRFFCLYVTFDFLFTSLLWLICIAFTGEYLKNLVEQTKNYHIHTSTFDIVMVSSIRAVLLLLAYALFRIQHWWMVAITTAGSSAFLIAKVFYYEWQTKDVFSVILLLCSFVLAWGEAWFLDFRVLPQEQRAREILANTDSERTSLLPNMPGREIGYQSIHDNARFYSPIQSNAGSEDEEDTVTFAPRNYKQFSPVDKEYKIKGKNILEQAWNMLNSDGWNIVKNVKEGIIYSKTVPKNVKLFKLHALLEINPRMLLDELYYRIENITQWNPTILQSKILYTVDNNTDVTYQVTTDVGNGIVKSRDFVNLRHWQMKGDTYVIAGASINFSKMPENKNFIRGENGPGAWVMQPVDGQPRKCIFQWLMNTDLKGWIPQYVIDQTLSSVMIDYLQCLQKHVEKLKTEENV